MSSIEHLRDQLARLNQIGIALSSTRDLKELLASILREARSFTRAEAGSLYIVETNGLRFAVSQNDLLARRAGQDGGSSVYQDQLLPLSKDSMAGYVGVTGETLNIPDVYRLGEDRPYRFNPAFDRKYEYTSRSMLLLPMTEPNGSIIGVLQLINARDAAGKVVPFAGEFENLGLSLASQAAVALRNVRLTEELKQAYFDTIFRLSVAAEYKDESTADHIRRIADYAVLIADAVGLGADRTDMMRYASPMHDIGKLGVHDSILQKAGKLTPEEYEEMKRHTVIGARILGGSDAPILQLSASIALTHHEKYDGSGYPQGLVGEQTPIEGRIVALADVFDALASARCYKPSFPPERCFQIIREGRGTHFDPDLADVFLQRSDDVLKVRAAHPTVSQRHDEAELGVPAAT